MTAATDPMMAISESQSGGIVENNSPVWPWVVVVAMLVILLLVIVIRK